MPQSKGRRRGVDRLRDPEAPPPSLGGQVCEWMEEYLVHGPGEVQGQAYRLHDDLRLFFWQAYELSPVGRRRYSEAALVLPKGVAKSEAAGAACCVEALGPVRFDGFDANGDPVGAPVTQAEVFVFANDLDQTGNCYENVGIMLGPETCSDELLEVYGPIDIGRDEQSSTRVVLPDHRGSITPKTSAPNSKEGGKTTFAVLEEPHLWMLPGMRKLHRTIRRNARKRADTWVMHSSNWFGPGEGSVLEAVYDDHLAGVLDLLWFARQVPAGLLPEDVPLVDLPVPLLKDALRAVYGSAYWITSNLDGIVSEIRRPSTPDHEANRFYLNRGRVSAGKWLDRKVWDGLKVDTHLEDGDEIAVGFDGSRANDATVLMACRLSDRLLEPIAVWEKPHGPAGDGWRVSSEQVDTAVEMMFGRFRVSRMFCDPPYWREEIESWARRFGDEVVLDLPTYSTVRMDRALDRFEQAVEERTLCHSGHDDLARHVLNAEVEQTRGGRRLVKPAGIDPDSPRARIDAAVAAVLAVEAAATAPDELTNRPSVGGRVDEKRFDEELRAAMEDEARALSDLLDS